MVTDAFKTRLFRPWRELVDMFRNKKSVIEVGLEAIQNVFSRFDLKDPV
jgi:hypothetical protein